MRVRPLAGVILAIIFALVVRVGLQWYQAVSSASGFLDAGGNALVIALALLDQEPGAAADSAMGKAASAGIAALQPIVNSGSLEGTFLGTPSAPTREAASILVYEFTEITAFPDERPADLQRAYRVARLARSLRLADGRVPPLPEVRINAVWRRAYAAALRSADQRTELVVQQFIVWRGQAPAPTQDEAFGPVKALQVVARRALDDFRALPVPGALQASANVYLRGLRELARAGSVLDASSELAADLPGALRFADSAIGAFEADRLSALTGLG